MASSVPGTSVPRGLGGQRAFVPSRGQGQDDRALRTRRRSLAVASADGTEHAHARQAADRHLRARSLEHRLGYCTFDARTCIGRCADVCVRVPTTARYQEGSLGVHARSTVPILHGSRDDTRAARCSWMSVLNDWIIYTVCVSALARVAVVVHSRVERVCLTATTLAAIVCQANPSSLSLSSMVSFLLSLPTTLYKRTILFGYDDPRSIQ